MPEEVDVKVPPLDAEVSTDEAVARLRRMQAQFGGASAPTEAPGPGFLENTLFRGVVGGVRDAAQGAVDIAQGGLSDQDITYWDASTGSYVTTNPQRDRFQLPQVESPTSFVGDITRGLSQFTAGFIPAHKALQGVQALNKLGKYRGITQATVAGGLADFVVFAPHEARLADLLEETWIGDTPIPGALLQYLASDPDDSAAEGRFKNVIEGFLAGATLEVVLVSARAMARGTKRAVTDLEARRMERQAIDEMRKALQKGPDHVTGLSVDEAMEAIKVSQIPARVRTEGEQNILRGAMGRYSAARQAATPQEATAKAPGSPQEPRSPGDPTPGTPPDVEALNGRIKELTDLAKFLADHNINPILLDSPDILVELTRMASSVSQDDLTEMIAKRILARAEAKAKPKGEPKPEATTGEEGAKATKGPREIAIPENLSAEQLEEIVESTIRKLEQKAARKAKKAEGQDGSGAKGAGDEVPLAALEQLRGRLKDGRATPAISLTDEALKQARKLAQGDEAIDASSIFNRLHMHGPDRVHRMMGAMARVIKPELDARRVGPDQKKTLEEIDTLADIMGEDAQALRTTMSQAAAQSADLASTLVAGKRFVQSLSRELDERMAKIEADPANVTPQDYQEAFALANDFATAMADLKEIQSGGARMVTAGRIDTADTLSFEQLKMVADDPALTNVAAVRKQKDFKVWIENGGEDQAKKLISDLLKQTKKVKALAAQKGKSISSAKALRKVLATGPITRVLKALDELALIGFLKGLKTHKVNTASGFLKSIINPAERILATFVTGDKRARAQAIGQLKGYFTFKEIHKEAAKRAWKALKAGEPILDFSQKIDENSMKLRSALDPRNFGVNPNSMLGKSWLRGMPLVRYPFHLMAGEDEYIKQAAYRAHIYGDLVAEAAEKGLKGEAVEKYVADTFPDRLLTSFDDAGRALDEGALREARDITFTTPLNTQNPLLRGVNTIANVPGLRWLLFPFVRTPVGILKEGLIDRNPLMFGRGINVVRAAKALRNGDAKAALAILDVKSVEHAHQLIARYMTGVGIVGAGLGLYSMGIITGGGPPDKDLNYQWREMGNIPYSIRVGDVSISMERIEPYTDVVRLMADLGDIFEYLNHDDAGKAAETLIQALANNITNRSYLQGLVDLGTLLSDDDFQFKHVAQSKLLAPLVGLASPVTGQTSVTDTLEGRPFEKSGEFIDMLRKQLPSYLKGILPGENVVVRNALGEPVYPQGFAKINPLAMARQKDDPVFEEFNRLGVVFRHPPQILGGVQLTNEQYNELLDIYKSLKVNSRTLRERLVDIIKTQNYQKLSEPSQVERANIAGGGGSDTPLVNETGKVRVIKDIMRGYAKAAEAEFLSTHPEVMGKVVQHQRNRGAAMSGDFSNFQFFE